MKALVIGATGAVGKDLVEQLLKDDSFERVDVFVRREMPLLSSKLVSHVVDFDHPEGWTGLLTGDVLFSCLGTTIKAAGSQDAQWKVDYTYQYDTAKAARANGVQQYILVSSVGADAHSKIFYSRMKGQLDWTPMPTEDVAAAMVRLAKSGKTGHGIITSQEIRIFAYSK